MNTISVYFALVVTMLIDQATHKTIYYGEFPDLKGCFVQAATLDDLFRKAVEELSIYYHVSGGLLPQATSLDTVTMAHEGKTVYNIPLLNTQIPLKSQKLVKKNLTIPEWLSKLGEKYNINFSSVLKTAVIRHLQELPNLSEIDRRMLQE